MFEVLRGIQKAKTGDETKLTVGFSQPSYTHTPLCALCVSVLPAQSSSHRVVHTNVLLCSARLAAAAARLLRLVGYICIAAVALVKVISFDSAQCSSM